MSCRYFIALGDDSSGTPDMRLERRKKELQHKFFHASQPEGELEVEEK